MLSTMPCNTYQFDDNPDMAITLKNATAKFVDWDQYLYQKIFDVRERQADADFRIGQGNKNSNETTSWDDEPAQAPRGVRALPRRARIKLAKQIDWARWKGTILRHPDRQSADIDREGAEALKIRSDDAKATSTDSANYTRYLVSSGRLIETSPLFKRMLLGGWNEGSRSSEDDLFEVSATDWDPDAFRILLDILHLNHQCIPRSLDLEMLAKVAVLVDYYECVEAMDMIIDSWVQGLKGRIPTTYCRDLILWLCVVTAFRLPKEYQEATAVALSYAKEEVPTFDLPIGVTTICMYNVF